LTADLSQTPDLAPVLFVMAPFLKCTSTFYGLNGLKHKESNRLNALCTGLCKAGFILQRRKNLVRIFPSEGKICTIDCFDDHRIAMAFALLPQKFRLNKPQVVEKSFPDYFNELKKI
jgi:3-phosphoshikimate 1-carboxyvinyltransferase